MGTINAAFKPYIFSMTPVNRSGKAMSPPPSTAVLGPFACEVIGWLFWFS